MPVALEREEVIIDGEGQVISGMADNDSRQHRPAWWSRRRLGLWVALLMLVLLAWSLGSRALAAPEEVPASSPAVLADLLENEDARNRLIEQLRELAPEADSEASDREPEGAADTAEESVANRLTGMLQRFTDKLSDDLASTRATLAALVSGQAFDDIERRWGGALQVFAATLAALLVAYFLLRLLAAVGFARLNRWVHHEQTAPQAGTAAPPGTSRRRRLPPLRLSRRLLAVLAAGVIDLAAAVLAALVAYFVAAGLATQPEDTLFAFQLLVAFVMIEAAKAVSRGVFATRYDRLRLLPLQRESARYWNRWLSLVIGLTGYCLLVLVPVTQAVLLSSVGRLLGLVIMLGVYFYAVGVIWRNRARVREGLLTRAERASAAVFGTLIRVLARTWYLIAIAYFSVLLVVSQADQQQALAFMLAATLQSGIAIAVGALLAAALSSSLARHIALPENWRNISPSLESRINAYVSPALKGLRLLILIAVGLVVFDAWRVFDLAAWLSSPGGRATLTMLFHVALVLSIAALGWTVVASLIEHRLGGATGRPASEREKTLLMLFRNAVAVVIAAFTALIVLSQIGVDIGPLIAGAGVVGLAIGFGAQKLVQDVITGVFIQIENGMNQDDIVEVTGLFGVVEKITVRSVALRTLDGGYHLIPFSAIDRVSNHTRGYGYHFGEYYVAYRESVDEAMAQLELAFQDLMEDPELALEVLEQIEIPGVTALDERGFRIRVMIKTTPGNQWAVQRAYNRLVKQRFDAAGIELPYPHTVLHFGRDRDGYAEPVDVRAVESLRQARTTRAGSDGGPD